MLTANWMAGKIVVPSDLEVNGWSRSGPGRCAFQDLPEPSVLMRVSDAWDEAIRRCYLASEILEGNLVVALDPLEED